MRQEGMRGLVRGRKIRTTSPGQGRPPGRGPARTGDFTAPAPNRAWVTDFTYVPTWSGFVYVAFAIDLYSRAIVGWAASTDQGHRVRRGTACAWRCGGATTPAAGARRDDPPLATPGSNTPRSGSPKPWRWRVCRPRSARVGDAYDNAVAESRDGPVQERGRRRRLTVPHRPAEDPRRRRGAHHDYVDWYNNQRLHSLLGNATPEEFEQTYYAQKPAHRPATPPTRRRHETRDGSLTDP